MAPLKIALVGVLGIGIAASLAFADHKPNHPGDAASGTWFFAGYTTATTLGGAMLPVLYEMCQFAFGPDARMALTEEWIKSPNITPPGASGAWIQPITTGSGPDVFFSDTAGNCEGWTVAPPTGRGGVAVLATGQILPQNCSVARAVACVVPQ